MLFFYLSTGLGQFCSEVTPCSEQSLNFAGLETSRRGLPEVTGPICRDAGVLRVALISEHVASGRMAHLLQRPQRSNDCSQGLVTQSVKWGNR